MEMGGQEAGKMEPSNESRGVWCENLRPTEQNYEGIACELAVFAGEESRRAHIEGGV